MKTLFQIFFRCLVSLAYAVYRIEGVNALLLILPPSIIVSTLRKYGARIGENVMMHSPLLIHNAEKDYSNLTIGEGVHTGRAVLLDLKDRITLGDRVTLSMKTTLITHTDTGESRTKVFLPVRQAPIVIENDAYLGANVIVLEGVTIGECAVVGAGSLVRKSVAARTLVAGNPAQEIKDLV